MEIARVLIADMPGPTWWEFLMQWGGLFTQAAAAAGTIGAVWIALCLSRRDSAWRQEDERRERDVVLEIVKIELLGLRFDVGATQKALSDCAAAQDPAEAVLVAKTVVDLMSRRLSVDTLWKLSDKLRWLPDGQRASVARLMVWIPTLRRSCVRISEWPTMVAGMQEEAANAAQFCIAILREFPISQADFEKQLQAANLGDLFK